MFLRKITLIYLLSPYIIFYFGWLKLPLSIVASSSLCLLFYLLYRQDASLNTDRKDIIRFIFPRHKYILIFCSGAILIMWISLSGLGGIGYQNSDYIKHNAILFDLVSLKWPVSFENSHSWLVYYIGYYLPPAMAGKLFNSYDIAEKFTLIWVSIGIILSIIWWLHLVGQRLLLPVLIFIFFSGLDSLGYLLLLGKFGLGEHLEWWSRVALGAWDTRIWQLSSNTTLFFWAPQHAIPAWLATPIIIKALESQNNRSLDYVLVAAATLLWSPFVTIGLLPFVIYKFFRERHQLRFILIFSPLLLLFEIPVIVYFLSQNSNIPWFLVYNHYDINKIAYKHILFLTLEILIFIPFLRIYWKNPTFLISLGIPLFLSFIKGGMNNDLLLRASIPALYCLALFFARSYNHNRGFSFLKMCMIGVFLIGAVTPSSEIFRSIKLKEHITPMHIMTVNPLTSVQYTGLKPQYFLFKESNNSTLIDKPPINLTDDLFIYDVLVVNHTDTPSLKTIFLTIKFKESFIHNGLCLFNNEVKKEFKGSAIKTWRPNRKITVWAEIIQVEPISKLLIGDCNQLLFEKNISLKNVRGQ